MKHTPGPWKIVERYGDGKFICVESDQERDNWNCLRCEVESDDCNSDMAKANAVLISAAPDLLAACKALLAHFNRTRGGVVFANERDLEEAARAAIAKAEGGGQ